MGTLTVEDKDITKDISCETPIYKVSGIICDSDGQVPENRSLYVYDSSDENGMICSIYLDDEGAYSIYLPAGNYKVMGEDDQEIGQIEVTDQDQTRDFTYDE